MRASLFITCIVDQMFPQVGVSMTRLLRRFGCEVDFPAAQTCCGQPMFNSGYVDEARSIARNHLKSFAGEGYIVSPSGSCTGMVRHYYSELFKDDPALSKASVDIADRSYEFSSFLVNVLGIVDVGAVCPHTVTFHPSCHASRLLGVRTEPLALLENVRNIKLIPLGRAEDCCGFGGTFSIKMSDVSAAMVAEKAGHIDQTAAEYLVGTDMGCLMNIDGYLKRHGKATKVMHLAEFLDVFSA